jgi:hypothetical protein
MAATGRKAISPPSRARAGPERMNRKTGRREDGEEDFLKKFLPGLPVFL